MRKGSRPRLTRRSSSALIEAMANIRGRRGLGFLIALVLTASGVTQGVCFMPGTGEPGPRDAHACCKKGWVAGTPECCLTGAADEDPARTVAAVALAAPPAVLIEGPQPPHPIHTFTAFASNERSHSPPGRTPLRI